MNIYSKKEIEDILQGLERVEKALEDMRKTAAPDPMPTRFEEGVGIGFKLAFEAFRAVIGLGPKVNCACPDGPEWIEMDRGAGQ